MRKDKTYSCIYTPLTDPISACVKCCQLLNVKVDAEFACIVNLSADIFQRA